MKITRLIFPVWILLLSGVVITGCSSQNESTPQTENHANADEHGSEEAQHTEAEGDHLEEESEHSGEVHLSQDQMASLNISVDTLRAGSASSVIERPASVMYDMDRIAKVGPRIEAKVVKVLKDLGDYVEEGEPIVQMSSVGLGKIKADYIRLRAAIKKEEAHFKREQNLYEQDISSQAELLQAELEYEQAKAELDAASEALRLYGLSQNDIQNIKAGSDTPLSYFYLSSPLSGTIQERNLSPGQTIGPNETPVHVADLSKVWVMIDGYEQDIRNLSTGQKVELSVRSMPGSTFTGTTDWISYELDKETRTMPVRALFDNPDGQLRAGMFGTARIYTNSKETAALIPVDAIQQIEGSNRVFVPGEEPGSFRPVAVRLGNERDGYVEVLAGLEPGQTAVLSGAFDLKSALTAATRSASHGH
ncbi:efflux RND transporter periplasmic adaptor subunit [Gracilimonas mengyeensis]|nr:efflux RND transporter periplasmic adaptor subunit [Gracilimonas mengyeensis]